jgi:SMP-30/Gluconolactonase/LRE-like region
MWILGRRISFLLPYAIIGIAVLPEAGAGTDVKSTKWTPPGEYTSGIEGPSADLTGNVYAANFGRQGSVGVVRPGSSRSSQLVVLTGGSVSSSTRVLPSQALVIADYKHHTLFLYKNGRLRKALQSNQFSQPNDVTVAADSTLFLSDPNWGAGTGRIWRVSGIESDTPRLELLTSPRQIGVVDGIDLSPDEKTLYTSESKSDKSQSSDEIWAYSVVDGQLMSPRLLYKFATADVDGLRTDIDGNIFVAHTLVRERLRSWVPTVPCAAVTKQTGLSRITSPSAALMAERCLSRKGREASWSRHGWIDRGGSFVCRQGQPIRGVWLVALARQRGDQIR